MNLQRKLELMLPGKSPDEILKSHEVNKYDHSVVLWKIENTQRGYTITHKLKPLDKDNTKESTKSKTQHFPRNDTVRLIDLNIRELVLSRLVVRVFLTLPHGNTVIMLIIYLDYTISCRTTPCKLTTTLYPIQQTQNSSA